MPEFYHPERETFKHGADMPHWQQGEVMQFVTFRLADSMPQSKLRQWRGELAIWEFHHPEPWDLVEEQEYHKRFTWKLENWLDEGHGACILKSEAIRAELEKTLMHDEGSRASHHAWVIMPNHVHLLFKPMALLDKLMQSWKGISAKRMGKGSIWQKNYRDTLIRDSQHFANAVRYIRRNPSKIQPGTFTLWESERTKAI